MKQKNTFSNHGQSITQALVSIGISAIALTAIGTTIASVVKSNKQLAQKLEALDVKNQLFTSFTNPANCTCQLSTAINPANIFDSTSPASLNLKSIKLGCASSSTLLATENALLPGTQTQLRVRSVELVDIRGTGNVEEYQGRFRITFDEGSLAGPLAPVQFNQKIYGDPATPADKKAILGCSNDSGVKLASGNNVVGTNSEGNVTINLATHGFDPLGNDPHIIVTERNSNYDEGDGNTVDATFCGFQRSSKLVFVVTCKASTINSDGWVRSSFDWIALQK